MLERLDRAVRSVETLSNRMIRPQAAANPMIDMLGGIAVASIVLYGGWRVIYHGATPGQFFSFITALLLATDPDPPPCEAPPHARHGRHGRAQRADLLDRDPAIVDTAGAKPLAIAAGKSASGRSASATRRRGRRCGISTC